MPEPPHPSRIALILGTLRPKHWIKSLFVLAPALFTLRILDPSSWEMLAVGIFGFSFIASGIYAFNDIANRKEDLRHSTKRFRPVASGGLSIRMAALLSVMSLGIGAAMLQWCGIKALAVGSTYMILMLMYTLVLRKLLIVDTIIIAVGFVLRVILGAFLLHEPVSHWLLLCTFTIALFLGMIKRRQEIVGATGFSAAFENPDVSTRSVLSKYPTVSILDGWINILAGMTVLCYALYTVDSDTVQKHHTGALIYTLPFALYGVFRYQQLAQEGRAGEDPTGLILKDVGMKVVVALWATVVGVILYLAGR